MQRSEIERSQQYRNALDKFRTKKMELPGKTYEKIAVSTRTKIGERTISVMDKLPIKNNLK